MKIPRIVPLALVAGLLAGFGVAAFPGDPRAETKAGPVFSPDTWDLVFDFVAVGSESAPQTVTVTNVGKTAEVFSAVTLVGNNRQDYRITSDSCTSHTLPTGGQCAVSVLFAPATPGTRIASVRFDDNTPCPNYIHLSGSGTQTSSEPKARTASCTGPEATTQTQTVTVQTVTTRTTTITTTTTTPGPTRTVAAPAPKPVINSAQSKQAIRLPRKCSSKRAFAVHFTPPEGRTFKKVSVRINGRQFKVFRGRRIAAWVSLKGLPRGRFTLLIDATLSPTGHYLRKRHYVTCVRDRKS